MDIDKIKSKLDSISIESNFLYSYNQIKAKLKIDNDSNFVIFLKSDTFYVITSIKNNTSQYKFYGNKFVNKDYITEVVKNIDSNDIQLLYLKQKIINKVKELNILKQLAVPFFYDFILSETKFGFNYYAISSTDKAFTFPLDTNYVFQFDKNAKLLKVKILAHKLTHINFDSNTEMIILVYDKNSPLIYATDIFKFNTYCFNTNIQLLDAFSISSKRKYIYNPQNKQIDVK